MDKGPEDFSAAVKERYVALFMNTCGKRIKLLRNNMGLTQEELVGKLEKAGVQVGRTYISLLESSDRLPSGEVLIGLAKALYTTTDYLVMLSDEPFRRPDENKPMDGETALLAVLGPEWAELWRQVYEQPPSVRKRALRGFTSLLRFIQDVRQAQLDDLAEEFNLDERGKSLLSALAAARESGALTEDDLGEMASMIEAFAEERLSNSSMSSEKDARRSSLSDNRE